MSQGYGHDTYCLDELRTGRLVSGPLLVAQAIYRRLTTPRGTLRGPDGGEESNYGIDLPGLIGALDPRRLALALPAMVRNEILKDDRVQDAAVDVVLDESTHAVRAVINISIVLVNAGETFGLTVSADALDVSLLEVTA